MKMKFILLFVLFVAIVNADVPPKLMTNQPGPRLSITDLVATAEGTKPFTYQWYRNNIAIPGETGEVLMIADPKETGGFHCVIKNLAGETKTGIVKFGNTYIQTEPEVRVIRKQPPQT